MVQFTYGPLSPVNESLLMELGFSARRGELILRNVPPATVWTIRRSRAKAIRPRTVAR
jgi:phosphatidylethanolamine/phosphatidyl-N-methylethanolamine N-methyltransferase